MIKFWFWLIETSFYSMKLFYEIFKHNKIIDGEKILNFLQNKSISLYLSSGWIKPHWSDWKDFKKISEKTVQTLEKQQLFSK